MPGSKLDTHQEAVIAALLTEPSHEKAAERAGISVSTLRAWLRRPEFRREYTRAKERLVNFALERLELATATAVDALLRAMKCGEAGVEVRAALGTLDQNLKAKDLRDLAKEVRKLSEAAKVQSRQPQE